MLQHRVEAVILATAEKSLQRLDVADGVPKNLHFGEPLVGVRGGAALERLEGVVDFAEPSALAQSGGLSAVCVGRLPLASFARPQKAAARLVVPTGRADVLVVLGLVVMMEVHQGVWRGRGGWRRGRARGWRRCVLVWFQQTHVHKPWVQVLKKMHVTGVKARIIVEVIRRGDGEGDIRQLHVESSREYSHVRMGQDTGCVKD